MSGASVGSILPTLNLILKRAAYLLIYLEATPYPSTKWVMNSPDQVSRAENHHSAIINKSLFDRVQDLRLLRTNMETEERGNRGRKSTHYSFCPKGSVKTQEE